MLKCHYHKINDGGKLDTERSKYRRKQETARHTQPETVKYTQPKIPTHTEPKVDKLTMCCYLHRNFT